MEMEKLVDPEWVRDRWRTNTSTLLQFVIEGLPVYDPQNPTARLEVVEEAGERYFKKMSPPAYYPEYHETGGFSNWRKAHPRPDRPHYDAYYTISNDLCVFKLSELAAFGKEHSLPPLVGQPHIVKNDADLFPELRFGTLKSYANEWAKKWTVIRKITLFRYSPFRPREIRNVPAKFALLFDIAGNKTDLKSFEKATNCFRTIRDEYGDGILYEDFMQPAFENVYRQGAPEGYQKEWRLDPKREGGEAFHYEVNPSWLLFDPGVEISIEGAKSAKQPMPVEPVGTVRTGPARTFTHSADFRSINKDGVVFTLTPKQAQVVQILSDAHENGTPEVGQGYIIEQVSGATSIKRLRDFFKSNLNAWNALIEQGKGKGTFRLKI
ncbi:MAG: hypothetical protein L7F78_04205 [Syntrophales bacterium LBB04]|nr:hypothetical protein [Syntrophales bacterium LBB04]